MQAPGSPDGTPRSMEDVHRTIAIPTTSWWRRLFAFVGPAYMVSVGYMDPGNWATDIAGGASFGYSLLWVLVMSNMMAVLLQTLSARLGLVTGHDLAQACYDDYPPAVRYVLFVLCEIAIAACDLAEALGSAIGINLLFGIPIFWAIVITGFDVLLLLVIQRFGIRKMEAFIVLLVATIGLCFVFEIFLSRPVWTGPGGVASGFVPQALSGGALYIAIGIIGATVMPHNLYLHSALVQSRNVSRSVASVAQACKYNLIDSIVALNGAFLVNASILIVAGAAFWSARPPIAVNDIGQAHDLLKDVLTSRFAPIAFAVALICAGQSSTVTGTLAGQITMEGFLHFRMRPWFRRVMTRAMAIGPALIVVGVMENTQGPSAANGGALATTNLLILSQVILSLQLPFAVVPLIRFTASRTKMGPFANRWWVNALAWLAAAVIIALNVKLAGEAVTGWIDATGSWRWLVMATVGPAFVGLGGLLLWMTFRPERRVVAGPVVSAEDVARAAMGTQKRFAKIGVALEATARDSTMLAEAVAAARTHQAQLVLMHVVEGVGGQWYGPQTGDMERRQDEEYINELAGRLSAELADSGVTVKAVLGYGNVPRSLVKMAQQEGVDLMIVGGHGHRAAGDILRGQTIDSVRHGLRVPILAVRE